MIKKTYILWLHVLRIAISALPILILILLGYFSCQEILHAQPIPLQHDTITNALYRSRQTAITRAVAKVSPAVVGINVTQVKRITQRQSTDPLLKSLFPELARGFYEKKIESLGSGFLISSDGYILTNEHVVEHASEILVTMTDGKHLHAQIVGGDPLTDIALLKVDGYNFPYMTLGQSNDLMVGEWVIALGNPFGLFELNDQPTVTVGVISALDRDWGRTEDKRLYLDMIQIDAAINHGNSGGPLVNALGEVIGMNTFIFTGNQYEQGFVGIGFAIPSNKINEIVQEIRQKGKVNRHYRMGILKVQNLNSYIINALRLRVEEGVIIIQLDSRGPAHKAGLREGDVIVAVNRIEVQDHEEFMETLRNMDLRVGDVLIFEIVRWDKQLTFKVKLEAADSR